MKTIEISISELEFNKFGLKSTRFAFSDLLDIITRELAIQRLDESVLLAQKTGLSKMTMEEISAEIKRKK